MKPDYIKIPYPSLTQLNATYIPVGELYTLTPAQIPLTILGEHGSRNHLGYQQEFRAYICQVNVSEIKDYPIDIDEATSALRQLSNATIWDKATNVLAGNLILPPNIDTPFHPSYSMFLKFINEEPFIDLAVPSHDLQTCRPSHHGQLCSFFNNYEGFLPSTLFSGHIAFTKETYLQQHQKAPRGVIMLDKLTHITTRDISNKLANVMYQLQKKGFVFVGSDSSLKLFYIYKDEHDLGLDVIDIASSRV